MLKLAQTAENWQDSKTRARYLRHLRTFSKRPEQRKANSKRMQALWADPTYRAKMIERRKHCYTADRMRKLSEAASIKGAWNKGLTKADHPALARMSEVRRGQIPDYGKYRAWYEGINGKIYMRSSWEVGYALYLDSRGIKWSYEPRFFYVGKGAWNGETYVPDFYLHRQRKYVEVKGRLSEANRLKIEAFKSKWPRLRYQMLSRVDLVKIGVIDARGHTAITTTR